LRTRLLEFLQPRLEVSKFIGAAAAIVTAASVLEFAQAITEARDLLMQRIDLLAVVGDHPAQSKVVLLQLLHVSARAASGKREGADYGGQRDARPTSAQNPRVTH
jgi:hypothetical protein